MARKQLFPLAKEPTHKNKFWGYVGHYGNPVHLWVVGQRKSNCEKVGGTDSVGMMRVNPYTPEQDKQACQDCLLIHKKDQAKLAGCHAVLNPG